MSIIENENIRSVRGVGIYTKGKYSFGTKNNPTKVYSVWVSMLNRCYSTNFLSKNETYKGCSVVEEWHNFQNFAIWFEQNYIEGYQLDKDLLIKNNKIYGPNTCCFIPQEVNLLLVNKKRFRGKYPIGVSKDKNKFSAKIRKRNTQCFLGNYNTIEEAFYVYKTNKENYLKLIAEEYKQNLCEAAYDALVTFKINITD